MAWKSFGPRAARRSGGSGCGLSCHSAGPARRRNPALQAELHADGDRRPENQAAAVDGTEARVGSKAAPARPEYLLDVGEPAALEARALGHPHRVGGGPAVVGALAVRQEAELKAR